MKPTETCKNCGEYSVYCRAGFFNFLKEDAGVCRKSGNTVKSGDSCELFKKPHGLPKITLQLIDNAISDAAYILNYFKNDK